LAHLLTFWLLLVGPEVAAAVVAVGVLVVIELPQGHQAAGLPQNPN
jgi:hypothetical protein